MVDLKRERKKGRDIPGKIRKAYGVVLIVFLSALMPSLSFAGALDFAKAADKAGNMGKYKEAVELYTEAIDMGGVSRHNLSIIHFKRGRTLAKLGYMYRAADDYEIAVRLNSKSLNFRIFYGSALMEKGEYESAVFQFKRAMAIDPTSVYPYSSLGGLWTHRGDYSKALENFNRALEIEPNEFWLRRQFGEFFFCFGHFARAEKEFKEAIRLSAQQWIHTTPIMIFLAQMKQGKEGKSFLTQYSAGKDPEKWPGPVFSLFLEKIMPSDFLAKAIASNLEQQNTFAIQVRMYLGYYYSLRGEREKAIEMLKWFVESSGKGTWGYLAALGELKRLSSARK
ncbi:MAG: tetratricopeptide repeat protein [Deltaproteobacteria bacterium]|nr:tetratricopeptide repeat protein [Deltaproteobacteria bacterium]